MIKFPALPEFIPVPPLYLAALLSVAVLLLIVLLTVRRTRLKQVLKQTARDPELAAPLPGECGSDRLLLRRSRLIEKIARRHGESLIPRIGIDSLWVERLARRNKRSDFARVLRYGGHRGLYQCFLLSLEKKQLAPILLARLTDEADTLSLRDLALAGKGELFDGRVAYRLFAGQLPEIREMAGDPEWPPRYFAFKILLHDDHALSRRAVWDTFGDPHPLIRKTVALEMATEESEKLYNELYRLALTDPVFEVRSAAWTRLQSDFAGRFSLEAQNLTEAETFHLLELLRSDSKEHENFALTLLEAANLELRFLAAQFLERCGSLKRFCLTVDRGDKKGLERSYRLLKSACQVNVSSFLSCVRETKKPATLLLGARLLREFGNRGHLTPLAKTVFTGGDHKDDLLPLYQATVKAVAARGDEEALQLLERELLKNKKDPEMMEFLLATLPVRGDILFAPTLFKFLQDPNFPAKRALREALKKMVQPETIAGLFTILRAERAVFPHTVRIEALKLLGELGLVYCLQSLLEQMTVFPPREAKEFAAVLGTYPHAQFRDKVVLLLESPDAKVRAALIASLAATGQKEFLRWIKAALKDADPDVRIASVWSLVEYRDLRSLNQATSMLRDPVERVRLEAARAFAAHGSEETLLRLSELLADEDEVAAVKRAAISGLGASELLLSIDLLVERLDTDESLRVELTRALAAKTAPRELTRLVEDFKNADPALRELLTGVFKALEKEGEEQMAALLQEDIPSLKPYVVEILEATGFVEEVIRRLSHRDPAVRRTAAAFLALVGSTAAFRGIVLAARDPDDEVRVQVVRALEKLETRKGKEILEALESDPDRRVRKYTHWAKERLKAKAPEAKAPEAKAPEAKAPEAKAPKAKAPEARAPKARAPKARAPEARAPKAKAR
jgi:HEAT repeat protein